VISVAKHDWNSAIARCVDLLSQPAPSTDLLTFYAALLKAQKEIYESVTENLAELTKYLPSLVDVVKSTGPPELAAQVPTGEQLLDYWRDRSDKQFFSKALFQPYAQRLVESGTLSYAPRAANRCPFCEGKPQVSFLKITEPSSETGNRYLLCATCLSTWEFRRVICASCNEERPAQLGYFQTSEFPHVRIEACDTCKHYIKGVDLTTLGLAVPLVDDVATAALDLWATEHGYTKIELNLVGL
jgi:FdhE protein